MFLYFGLKKCCKCVKYFLVGLRFEKMFCVLNNFNNFERKTKMCVHDFITKQDPIIVFI
jgi:hypothetical protein